MLKIINKRLNPVDFTDYHVVRNLIFNRVEVESIAKFQHSSVFLGSRMIEHDIELTEYVENIYKKLDEYIRLCNFNTKNLEIIKLLFEGVSISEIGESRNVGEQTIFNRIRRIVLKINLVAELERSKPCEDSITKWQSHWLT